jgi:small subunit ribosomal protein S20
MARHKSAVKAARQANKRAERNSQARASYRTTIKKLRTALQAKDLKKDVAKKTLPPLLNEVQRVLMKAASKNLIKRETASRQIARLSAAVHRLSA